MARRTRPEWLNLIQEYQASGLSQAEFCRRKGLDSKYFSKRRSGLKKAVMPFVAVRCEAPTPMSVPVRVLHRDTVMTVSDCSPAWLGKLLRELAR